MRKPADPLNYATSQPNYFIKLHSAILTFLSSTEV